MEKTQRNNIMLAFFTLLAVIVIVSIIGFFTLGKGPEIIQGQAEATEYRVSSKVPGRILKFFVSEGDKVKAGDTLAILEAPDVMAKLSQAQAAEQAAQALNEKAVVAIQYQVEHVRHFAIETHSCLDISHFFHTTHVLALSNHDR